jgi:hypothetical protein
MKFEVVSAFVIGILLPLLETTRRGIVYWSVNVTTMAEDYLAGGLLLFAALLSLRGKASAPRWLVVAWAYVTGMMSSSFFYQVEATIRGINLEPGNTTVLVFKFALWGTSVISLVLSFRYLRVDRTTDN